MKNLQLVLLVVLSAALGAAITLLVKSDTASAQGPRGYRECFILAGDPGFSHVGNPAHVRNPVGRFPVPPGWNVVGALGGARNGLYLCR